MPHKVWTQSYGKSRVRVTQACFATRLCTKSSSSASMWSSTAISRPPTHGATIRAVVPTDTMKNTVHAFARELDVREVETFAWTLGSHFIENFDHVAQAMVKVTETPWQRVEIDGKPHPHAFLGTSTERRTCQALVNRTGEAEPEGTIECGLEGLVLLKTTASGFSKFLRDEFTTLKETDDRIFATAVTAAWSYNDTPDDWRGIRERIRATLIREFAARFSPSVQATLYEMCSAVLDDEPVVEEISLSMPNLHRHLIDLSPFDLDNPNVLFLPTDEPHGSISASVCRERDESSHDH